LGLLGLWIYTERRIENATLDGYCIAIVSLNQSPLNPVLSFGFGYPDCCWLTMVGTESSMNLNVRGIEKYEKGSKTFLEIEGTYQFSFWRK
jgi:hypothetical protein